MEMHLLEGREFDWVQALNSLSLKNQPPLYFVGTSLDSDLFFKKKIRLPQSLDDWNFTFESLYCYKNIHGYNLKVVALVPGGTWRVGTRVDEKSSIKGVRRSLFSNTQLGISVPTVGLQLHCHVFWSKDAPCWRRGSSWSRGQVL